MPKPLLQPMAVSGDVRFLRRKPPDVTEPDAQTRNILVPFNRVLDQFHSEWSALMGFTRRPCNCASCTALLSRKNHRLLTENHKSNNSFLWRQLTAPGSSPNTFFLSP